MTSSSPLALENPVFRVFLAYAVLLILKIFALILFISYNRIIRKVYANEEDAKSVSPKLAIVTNDPTVERYRRIVANDLETVIPVIILGMLYVCTGPSLWAATLHFRLYTGFRFLHTLVYIFAIRQPARFLCHLGALGVAFSMALAIFKESAF